MIKVSIIIPAYNIENYIERAINSAINQTLKEIEIIIINDGSTDKTFDIIEKKSKQDSRIKIISQENQGPNHARINGLSKSNGEYIQFLDGDDWLDLDTCKILYQNAKQENSDVVLYHLYSTDGNEKSLFSGYYNFDQNNKVYKELLLWHIFPSIVLKFIRREFLVENKITFPKNLTYSEDLAAGSLLFMYEPKVSKVDNILYYYYMRTNSATNGFSKKVIEIDQAVEFIKENLIKKKLFKECKYEFEYTVFNNNFLYYTLSYVTKNISTAKKLFQLYKSRNIKINENPYIKKVLDDQSVMMHLVIKGMYKNFYLGAFLMYFRTKINNVLIQIEDFFRKK